MAINAKPRSLALAVPYFDVELHELWVDDTLVKRLDCRATNQMMILLAFQELGWRRRIDDPLRPKYGADPKARLRTAIHSLNRRQHANLIRFHADGSGQGIRWDPNPVPPPRSDRNRRKLIVAGAPLSIGRRFGPRRLA